MNCINYATVKGTMYAGGILGSTDASVEEVDTVVKECINYGHIESRGYAGGLAGCATYEENVSGTNYGEIVSTNTPTSAILGNVDGGVM